MQSRYRRRAPLAPALIACFAMLLCACASRPPKAEPTTATSELHFVADAQLNPDRTGRAAPVLVGVYMLKSTTAFDAADFVSLQDHAKEALGTDLLSFEQLILVPGETKTLTRPLTDGAQALGFVAGYRVLGASAWKTRIAVPPHQDPSLWSTIAPVVPFSSLMPTKPMPLRIDITAGIARLSVRNMDPSN
jgi:type VI secretion system protein VasD